MNINKVVNNDIGSACGKPALFVTIGNVKNKIDPKNDRYLPKEKTFTKKNMNKKDVTNRKRKFKVM